VELPEACLAVDLGAFGQACRRDVDGLLGADFFQGRVIQIDFAKRKLRLADSASIAAGDQAVELKVTNRALLAPLAVDGGKSKWVRVDTGCASALHWVTGEPRPLTSEQRVAIGLTELSVPTARTTVRLGETVFPSLPTGVHQRPIFPGESGLLGNGLLDRFERVTFDMPAGRLIFHRGGADY
jgi:hypothetical protein